ncbi:MAG: pentapeptide repeat-containing protein [Limisphaerales bacterium]
MTAETPGIPPTEGMDKGAAGTPEPQPAPVLTREDEIIARYREAQASGSPLPMELQKLSGMNFLGRDFSGLDLSGCDFTGSELSRCQFKGTIATHAKFDGATLFQACLDGGEFMTSSFREANLSEASLQNAGFGETHLEGANLILANLDGTTLTKSSLKGARIHMASMQDARLLEADLTGAEFNQANLAGADLRECNVEKADFGRADIRGIQLRGLRNYVTANWIGADIRDIDFTGAYLVRRHIVDENYLDEFQKQGRLSRVIYWIWWATSDCGRSLLRWGVLNIGIIICFGLAFKLLPDVHTAIDPEAPLKEAGFGTAVSSGVVVVDGTPVPYDAAKDTLFGVLDRIYTASKSTVQGSYHAEGDRIELWSAGTPLKIEDSDGGNLVAALHLTSENGHASSESSVGTTTPALYYPSDLQRSAYETIYFSFVVALTLGFGDVLPKTVGAQVMVNLLTLVGYVGLGGLLTIFSNQLGRRGE